MSTRYWLYAGPQGDGGPVSTDELALLLRERMLTLAAVIPGYAPMIGLTGVSIGKWLFGGKVVKPSGKPIGVLAAFGRELQVWFHGLFFGVPLISLFTLGGLILAGERGQGRGLEADLLPGVVLKPYPMAVDAVDLYAMAARP
jgi:hypothetical protein